MATIQDKENWRLIRTSNGEWISEEYAVFPDALTACMYQLKAARQGMKLSKQIHCDGTAWYYKHEIEAIDAVTENKKETKPVAIRKLKIAPNKTNHIIDIDAMINEKEAYYDRTMAEAVATLLKGKLSWMIDYVYKHEELDFQTGESWFSIYKGTGRIFTVKSNGTMFADPKYMELMPEFYESPTIERLDTLLAKIAETKSLSRYYIGTDGKKKEGYYQNLISRRYTLHCMPEDDLIIVDKEFVLGYKNIKKKREWQSAPKEWLRAKIESAKDNGIPGTIKEPGTECDFVGITKDGDLLLMELKRYEDTPKIYLSPLQIGHYDELTRKFMEVYYDDFSASVTRMLRQKIDLGLIKPAWQSLPKKLSGKIKLAVIVGGTASKTAKERFSIMKRVAGKEITYYTCDESTGTLIEETC